MLVCFSKLFMKDKELVLLEVLFGKLGEKNLTFLMHSFNGRAYKCNSF